MSTVTVLAGPERRRRWTSAEKRRIIEESLQPGASVTAVARRHDVHPNLLHGWRRQARTGALDARSSRSGCGDPAAFAAVTLAAEPALAAPAAAAAPGVIEIEFASGARLRITGAVEAATASAVVAAVASARR
jgi:transposase